MLPLMIIILFIGSAFSDGFRPGRCGFSQRFTEINTFTFIISKILCIIFVIFVAIIGPLLVMTLMSPRVVADTDREKKFGFLYQLMWIIPCSFYYTITLSSNDDTIDYYEWIAFISCIFYVTYSSMHRNDIMAARHDYFFSPPLKGDIDSCCLDILMVFFVVAVKCSLGSMAYFCGFVYVLSAPFYKSSLIEEYNRWYDNSGVLECIINAKQPSDEMDILYCQKHHALHHAAKNPSNLTISQCMQMHREWQVLSLNEKYHSLKSSFKSKQWILYHLKWIYIYNVTLNYFMPVIVTLILCLVDGLMTNKQFYVLCSITVVHFICQWMIKYDKLKGIYKVKNIVLVWMIEDLLKIYQTKSKRMERINNSMWYLVICDVVDGHLPPELCNVIFEYLTVSCDGNDALVSRNNERSSFDDF